MAEKFVLQDGINVYEENGDIVLEDESKLGSSNRYFRLGSVASQGLLDFLSGNHSELTRLGDEAVEQSFAADSSVCSGCGHIDGYHPEWCMAGE